MLDFENGVEAIEERFEVNVFGVLNNPRHACPLGLVVLLHEALADDEGVLLLLSVGLLADPDVDMLVELQNEAVIGIKMLSLKRSLLDLAALYLSRFI